MKLSFPSLLISLALGAYGCGDTANPIFEMDAGNPMPDSAVPMDSGPSGYVSDGMSIGTQESALLQRDETYAGRLNAVELAVLDRAGTDTFEGRIRNETASAICDVRVAILLDGTRRVTAARIPGMQMGDGVDFRIDSDGQPYSDWRIQVDATGCSSVGPALGYTGNTPGMEGGGGEGGEGGGGEGGEGGGGEGGEGGGGEGGTASFPIDQPFMGTESGLDFTFAWDPTLQLFRGTMQNRSGAVLCASRLEVHADRPAGAGVLELGPTIQMDMQVDETINIVFEPGEQIETYQLHPESAVCP